MSVDVSSGGRLRQPRRGDPCEQAIACVCAWIGKERDKLTVGDLVWAQAQAQRVGRADLGWALAFLIEVPGVRDIYCSPS